MAGIGALFGAVGAGGNPMAVIEVGMKVMEEIHSVVKSIDDLKPGDHIAVFGQAGPLYKHHAIVVKMGPGRGEVQIVSFTCPEEGTSKGLVMGETIDFDKQPIYMIKYNQACFPPDEVIERAFGRIDSTGGAGANGYHAYHFTQNNCEHFATWCKTGKAWSAQVDEATQQAIKMTGPRPFGGALGELFGATRHHY